MDAQLAGTSCRDSPLGQSQWGFIGDFIHIKYGNDMYKTSGRTDASVHSFYPLPIHSLPSSLPRAAVHTFYSLLFIFSRCSASFATHARTLLRRWLAIPLSLSLPFSLPHLATTSMSLCHRSGGGDGGL